MFTVARFKLLFPIFKDIEDSVITLQNEEAQIYLDVNCKRFIDRLENLVTAHLLQNYLNLKDGEDTRAITSASIDKVSITYAQTENNSFFGTTSYGIEFLQLLKKCNGGFKYYGKKSC